MLYIIGHIKPDLDSAVSAMALKFLFDQVDCYERKNAKAVLADPANLETKTIFKKFGFILPKVLNPKQIKKDDRFVLVDHNEESQRLNNISNEQITDIFDHHKVNLNLPALIFITIKPWGSSSTLIYWLMEQNKLIPDKKLAGLMISAILSDTVGLKSPTTTKNDKIILEKLNKIAKISDLDQLILEIFKAKSDISGLSDKQLLTKDYKIFDFHGKKVLINQIETVEQQKLIQNAKALINGLANLKKELKLNLAFCVITDVLKINSKCFAVLEDELILIKAFPKAKKIKPGVFDLGPIMSRKKEIVPAIEKLY